MAYDNRASKRKSGRRLPPSHHRHRSRNRHGHESSSSYRRPVTSGEKCKDYCRKFVAFLFSHIGISAIVVAYMIGGALLFQRLEGEATNDINISVGEMIIQSVDRMWIITNEINILNRDAWDQIIRNETNIFSINLIKQIQSGFDNEPRNNKWEFPGAFLFCLTVITTIGYGHIAPITAEGRAATIVYAIFGIPLMLLYLANIGGTLAKSFRYVYGKFQACCSLKHSARSRSARSRSRRVYNYQQSGRRSVGGGERGRGGSAGGGGGGGGIGPKSSIELSPFKGTIKTPKGSGPTPATPGTSGSGGGGGGTGIGTMGAIWSTITSHHHQSANSSLPSSPISKVTRNIPFIPDSSSRHETPELVSGYRLGKSPTEPNIPGGGSGPTMGGTGGGTATINSGPVGSGGGGGGGVQGVNSDRIIEREPSSSIRMIGRDEVINENRKGSERVHVPISLCLFILIAYVSIGGILFSGWESWEVHDGIYFCFITLSTIGFGDLVPGEKSLKSENMILCALYILMGLALIAMCFNLMQEGVIHKVKTLGIIIGIIKDPDAEDDYYYHDDDYYYDGESDV